MKAKSKKVLVYLEDVFIQYENNEDKLKAANLKLDTSNQQLQANELQLKVANQQLDAINQQLLANEQHLKAKNQQLDAINQQLQASEQQLKAANAKLRNQTRELLRLATVVAVSNDAITIRDLDGNITSWNAGATKMYGYSEDEALKMNWLDLVHEEFEFIAVDIIERLKNNEQIESIETKRISKDGKVLDVWIVVTRLEDENGNLIGVVSTERDITERKQMENELLIYHEQLEKLVEERSTELKNEISVRKLAEVELKAANQQLHAANQQLLASNQQLKASELKQINTYQKLLEKTKQVEIQNEQLLVANNKATESDRLKSAFLANMSHEIRTPMNGILGFAGLLKEPDLKSENQQQYIEIIEKSGARMLNIINEIIDISKIESGIMNIYNSSVDINEILEECHKFFRLETEQKKIDFKLTKSLQNNHAIITTDHEKLNSILINLIKNSIKYTRKGSIEFGYNLNKSKTEVVFFVKDTGIGIPKDRQVAIFERFIKADIEDKMAHQGAGLGLAITRAYVELLKGEIWLESEVNVGSTFYFTIPNRNENIKEFVNFDSIKEERNQTKNLKILIADDDESSNQLMAISVKDFANEIVTVITGKEAIEVCKNNADIDLVLMDI
ncbi:MAG: PAS domain S-box protein [Rikenellaceae bacterium]